MNTAMLQRAAYDPLDVTGRYQKSKDDKADAAKQAAEYTANVEAQQKAQQQQQNVGILRSQGANLKKGGSASSRADGIATKGHTRGKMV
jgi:hypothetical protein